MSGTITSSIRHFINQQQHNIDQQTPVFLEHGNGEIATTCTAGGIADSLFSDEWAYAAKGVGSVRLVLVAKSALKGWPQ